MTRRVVDRPWAVVAADMMEFPRSKNQNKYLLVFQDLFTRWIEIVPLRKANGVNVLRAFEELVLFRWETPEFLLTDNGKEFDNAVMERNTNEEQRRSFAAVVRGATGRTAPSVRPAMDERAGASSSERNASEEARASQEAVAELNEYVRLMELGVPARLRPEPEGRAVVEVSGELIPVFARPSMHASEDAMDWEGSRSARQLQLATGRRGNNERTPTEEELPVSVDRPAALLARASVLHRRARDVARTEEESRCWRRRHGQCWSSWWRPVNRWKNGTARHSRRFFVARLKRKFCCWRRGRRRLRFVAQVRRRRKAHGCRPHLWHPFKNHLRCRCPPPVQQVSYVAGLHGLVFQPFAVQQQRLPQTEYPLDGQQQRQLRRPGPYQEQQQHRQLPRRQPRNNISERKSAWREPTDEQARRSQQPSPGPAASQPVPGEKSQARRQSERDYGDDDDDDDYDADDADDDGDAITGYRVRLLGHVLTLIYKILGSPIVAPCIRKGSTATPRCCLLLNRLYLASNSRCKQLLHPIE
ncbi:unnamed protein product [Trichogramma brassicae]|uniref:Integrase catalytic domain-containing protein n=1 Tax=Trichogramma brassicae TaxID=86971 RepID=A0A6H5ILC0_9HYME|nr:unnamed protein product [Trichogramma brassicae]